MNKDTRFKLFSILAYLLAVAGLLWLIKNKCLISASPFGIAEQVLCAALMVWARITFGLRSFHATANTTKGTLVTNGPYRWWRHPIYASVTYFVWVGVISFPLPLAFAAAALVTAGLVARMLTEEKFLKEAYPEYGDYMKRTFRLVPFVF